MSMVDECRALCGRWATQGGTLCRPCYKKLWDRTHRPDRNDWTDKDAEGNVIILVSYDAAEHYLDYVSYVDWVNRGLDDEWFDSLGEEYGDDEQI